MKHICVFLGIDVEEAIDLVTAPRKNDRMTQPRVQRIRRVADSRLLSVLFRHIPLPVRRRALNFRLREGPRAQVEISAEWRERIIDRARENNRKLVEEWGLPLARYSYPL